MSRHNQDRRKKAYKSLTLAEQAEVHQSRLADKQSTYPIAPTYRDDNPNPHQGARSSRPKAPPKKTRPGGGFRNSSKRR